MEITKNLDSFEYELRSIELDSIEKFDPSYNMISKFIYASKYDKEHNLYLEFIAKFENNIPLYPFKLDPDADTYKNDLVYLSLNVYNEFLLMNIELQKGVLRRLDALRGFLFKAKEKMFKYGYMSDSEFYSLDFFNDLYASFIRVKNGINWRDYLIEKEIADIILNAIFDRIGVLDELIDVTNIYYSNEIDNLKKPISPKIIDNIKRPPATG
ncbi:hypothetical protein [Emticicia fontis]